MAEESGKLPRWYDATRELLAFIDGPRAGEWVYADTWADTVRLAQLNRESQDRGRTLMYRQTGRTIQHREDDRIVGRVMTSES